MTLPLRKKLPTTVQSIRSQVKGLNTDQRRQRDLLKHSLWLGVLIAASHYPSSLQAQSPGWQPNRLPNSSSMQPLGSAPSANHYSANNTVANGTVGNNSVANTAGSNDSGVVLRWRTSARVGPTPSGAPSTNNSAPTSSGAAVSSSLAARALDANTAKQASPNSTAFNQNSGRASAVQASGTASVGNPLRSQPTEATQQPTTTAFAPRGQQLRQRSVVQPANFQAPPANMPTAPSLGGAGTDSAAPPTLSMPGNASNLQAPPTSNPQGNFPPITPPADALNVPEDAPAPPIAAPKDNSNAAPELNFSPAQDPNANNEMRPSDRQPPENDEPNPFKNRNSDEPSPSDEESAKRSRDLEKKKDDPDSTANCEAFRDKLRNSTIQKINLNAAPRYGQGLGDTAEKAEKQRLDFASSSEVRDWCDRHGRTIIQGRMIDLINEQVVLDINGQRREIPLRDLCDVDLAYVGKVWHLPITCGAGYDQVAGRNFVPSAMQWKASGLCHKPLYFEEVQLERYGHEIGPILQPLVSSAHFFGNIAVLPYKMGIHPPNECQYALGYYRPGNCAPYMLPPVPISLRGAAVQAGAVVTGAALVP